MYKIKRKHLRRLDEIFNTSRSPIYFISMCSFNRQPILTLPLLAEEIRNLFGRCKELYGWAVGKYVIMPDHIHFFCQPVEEKKALSGFIRDIKRWTTRRAKEENISDYIWQKEFFDHLLRSDESYEEKWEYVRWNPVRAGLCNQPEEWKYYGKCDILEL